MFLSRLILNPLSRQVQQEIARPYEMHRTILRAFPDDLPEGVERVLFRVDANPRTGALHLLVQSLGRPDWGFLIHDHPLRPYLAEVETDNPSVKAFALRVAAGQAYAFRLFANPTKRLGKNYGTDTGKRVGLYHPDEQEAWLQRKGDQAGFRVLSTATGGESRYIDKTRNVEFHGVRFDGMLQVQDAARFQAAVEQGIGSGKAFGFGLLSVAAC